MTVHLADGLGHSLFLSVVIFCNIYFRPSSHTHTQFCSFTINAFLYFTNYCTGNPLFFNILPFTRPWKKYGKSIGHGNREMTILHCNASFSSTKATKFINKTSYTATTGAGPSACISICAIDSYTEFSPFRVACASDSYDEFFFSTHFEN